MSEARLWSYLRTGVGPLWEAQRHEDRHSTGIPDVSYSTTHHGWIELKYLPKAPKRADAVLKIEHFTPDQRNWLTRHGKRGGRCFLLLQVEQTYMLFSWEVVPKIGRVSLPEHREMARKVWDQRIDFTDLVRHLDM